MDAIDRNARRAFAAIGVALVIFAWLFALDASRIMGWVVFLFPVAATLFFALIVMSEIERLANDD